jgi:molybdate-binding protein
MAVATGSADTGMATRAAAATFGLGFVRVAWEPFELALPRDALELAEPLIEAIRVDGAVLAQRLGGYELLA